MCVFVDDVDMTSYDNLIQNHPTCNTIMSIFSIRIFLNSYKIEKI